MASSKLTLGRLLMALAGVSNSIAPYIADFNETHVYNPTWPPHARFHNGQTMSMGLLLGLLANYYIWRPAGTLVGEKENLWVAALVGSLYFVSGLSAILYPGTMFMDPDLLAKRTDGGKLLGLPAQVPVFSIHIALVWLGYGLEMRRLRTSSAAFATKKGK